MGVHRSESPSPPSSSSSSSSSSFSSPSSCFSSCFSSTSTQSTISLTSSSNSTLFSKLNPPNRCEGLDLLVKAVNCIIAGSVVGVPYIQRRVIRRRKRAIKFSHLIIGELIDTQMKNPGEIEENLEGMRGTKFRRAKLVLPSKYNDSVLHEWKPPRIRRRRSGSGL